MHKALMKIKASMHLYIEDPEKSRIYLPREETRGLKVSRELHLYIAMIIGRASLRHVYRPVLGEKM